MIYLLSIVIKEKSMKVGSVVKELIRDCGFNSLCRCEDFCKYLCNCKLSLSLKEFYLNCMNGNNQCKIGIEMNLTIIILQITLS